MKSEVSPGRTSLGEGSEPVAAQALQAELATPGTTIVVARPGEARLEIAHRVLDALRRVGKTAGVAVVVQFNAEIKALAARAAELAQVPVSVCTRPEQLLSGKAPLHFMSDSMFVLQYQADPKLSSYGAVVFLQAEESSVDGRLAQSFARKSARRRDDLRLVLVTQPAALDELRELFGLGELGHVEWLAGAAEEPAPAPAPPRAPKTSRPRPKTAARPKTARPLAAGGPRPAKSAPSPAPAPAPAQAQAPAPAPEAAAEPPPAKTLAEADPSPPLAPEHAPAAGPPPEPEPAPSPESAPSPEPAPASALAAPNLAPLAAGITDSLAILEFALPGGSDFALGEGDPELAGAVAAVCAQLLEWSWVAQAEAAWGSGEAAEAAGVLLIGDDALVMAQRRPEEPARAVALASTRLHHLSKSLSALRAYVGVPEE